MSYFPLFLDVKNSSFLIVGAGNVALAKLEAILQFTTMVTILAKDSDNQLLDLIKEKGAGFIQGEYNVDYLEGHDVVVAATNDKKVNQKIVKDARSKGVLVNVVDDPNSSDFIFGANIKYKDIIISFSTSGSSPVFSRMLKRKLNVALPNNLELFNDFIKKNRSLVKNKLSNLQSRRLFWENIFEGEIEEEISIGNLNNAQKLLEQKLSNSKNKQESAVYFIGAGPGDPELITLKAVKLLSKADVVLYDRLVSDKILSYARRDAIKINVGKKKDSHRYNQEEINNLIREYVLKGNIVARLKGGDPSIFAHLSEELNAIIDLNVPYQIVPGISAAIGAAAYSSMPLTSRDNEKSVKFLTIYKNDLVNDEYWKYLASDNDTLVFYMSSHNLEKITNNLVRFGKDKNTPVAIIEQATTIYQKTYVTNIGDFSNKFGNQEFISPSLVIIGNVVKFYEKFKWKEESLDGIYFNPIKMRKNGY